MQFGDTFYLILGDEWVGLCVRLETLIAKVEDIVIYRIPEMVHQHPATGRWLSKTKLRKQLRSFLSRCRRTLEYIGDWNQRAKEFLLKGDIANATAEFNSAAEQVTKLEEEWETLQRQVALLFL
jgi:phage shock protein A